MEGKLQIYSQAAGTWEQKHFTLDDQLLEFYQDEAAEENLGFIHLSVLKIQQPDEVDETLSKQIAHNPENLIILNNGSCNIMLRAPDAQTQQKWLATIKQHQKKLKDTRYESESRIEFSGAYPVELLNKHFNTSVFSDDPEFMNSLAQIYSQQAILRSCIEEILPYVDDIEVFKKLAEEMAQDLQKMKEQQTKCADQLENQRIHMNEVAVYMLKMRDALSNSDQRLSIEPIGAEQVFAQPEEESKDEEVQAPQIIAQSDEASYFKDSKIFCNKYSRTQLPFLWEENKKIPLWDIAKKLVGKDLTKVSMPVIINEPLSALQKCAEAILLYQDLVDKAAQNPEPLMRLVYATTAVIAQFNLMKYDRAKPFNPVLGETFELVTDKYRYISEQVSHHPPMSAQHIEGPDYIHEQHCYVKPKFHLDMGRGKLEIYQDSKECAQKFYFSKFDENVTVENPYIVGKNLFLGLYFDIDMKIQAYNDKTGDSISVQFSPRSKTNPLSTLKGKCFDSQKRLVYELEGSWMTEVTLKDVQTGQTQVIWQEKPELIQNHKRQFNLSQLGVSMNYLNEEMKHSICPNDSRFRMDQRLFEQGLVEEADDAKMAIENNQRNLSQARVQQKKEWKAQFFREITTESGLRAFEFIKDVPEGYWERRKRNDWQGIENLFANVNV